MSRSATVVLALAFPPLMTEEVEEEFLLSNGGRTCSDIFFLGGCGYVMCMLFRGIGLGGCEGPGERMGGVRNVSWRLDRLVCGYDRVHPI